MPSAPPCVGSCKGVREMLALWRGPVVVQLYLFSLEGTAQDPDRPTFMKVYEALNAAGAGQPASGASSAK